MEPVFRHISVAHKKTHRLWWQMRVHRWWWILVHTWRALFQLLLLIFLHVNSFADLLKAPLRKHTHTHTNINKSTRARLRFSLNEWKEKPWLNTSGLKWLPWKKWLGTTRIHHVTHRFGFTVILFLLSLTCSVTVTFTWRRHTHHVIVTAQTPIATRAVVVHRLQHTKTRFNQWLSFRSL